MYYPERLLNIYTEKSFSEERGEWPFDFYIYFTSLNSYFET